MARKPNKVHWERKGHTQAKHRVLTEYLARWIPILATQDDDLILIDGFAGPGRYEGGEKGSPLLMLDAYARRADRSRLGVTAHFFFIEKDRGRAEALQAEIDNRKAQPDIEVEVIAGDYDREFPKLLRELRSRWPRELPPIFAFVDPFGGEQNQLELTHQLLRLPRCEALIFVPMTHFARFIDHPDMEETLRTVFGGDDWKEAQGLASVRERVELLVDLFEKQLKHSCKWVRAFELVPQTGGNSHFLFFGTSSKKGLAKMKEAMWKLDPVAGQLFKDSTEADHPVLFEPEPDVARLLTMLEEEFADSEFSIEEAEDYVLLGTPFLHGAHLKRRTLAPAERERRLEVTKSSRKRANSYPPGSRMHFVEPR